MNELRIALALAGNNISVALHGPAVPAISESFNGRCWNWMPEYSRSSAVARSKSPASSSWSNSSMTGCWIRKFARSSDTRSQQRRAASDRIHRH